MSLLNPARYFAWKAPGKTDKTIVFPRLQKLAIVCGLSLTDEESAEEDQRIIYTPPCIKPLRVEFPKLCYFRMDSVALDGFASMPDCILSYLDKLVLIGEDYILRNSKIKRLKPISHLEISIDRVWCVD